jgi:hypothetical protein
MEDGVRQGAALALAAVHFRFHDLVDVHEVARGFPMGVSRTDMAFLMPCLEEGADAVLALAPLDDILRGPSQEREG